MALILCEGFEALTYANRAQKWDYINGGASEYFIQSGGRVNTAGKYLQMSGSNNFHEKTLDTPLSTYIVGFGVYFTTTSVGYTIFRAEDADTAQQTISVNAGGTISVAGQTSTLTITPNRWYFLELKCTVHNTTGSVELRIDGATYINATNIDTQVTANASVNRLGLYQNISVTCHYDDFYLCDTTGSNNNTFLGDVVIETVMPTGVGTNSQFTPTSGANWTNVDEIPQDGDTSIISSGTVGHRDTYAIGDVSATGGTVKAVVVNLFAKKTGTSARGVKATVKSGATYGLSSEKLLATNYVNYQCMFETDPNTSAAWTESAVNAMEAGLDVSS